MITKVRKVVKKEADEADWKFHILPVLKYAKLLSKKKKVNQEVLELAVLLHDIGRFKYGGKNHEVTGIKEAEKILKKFKYSPEIIKEIKHCVASHRRYSKVKPKTEIAKILVNADAMAHFDILPVFFYWRSKKQTFTEAFKWVEKKIEKSWQKLTLPEAKKLMKEKYLRVKEILKTNKEYL